ncbi:head GIN domain-containing protein [Tenacibaculum dicentrarchi]|uniref:head GIN domain-containing protein n=1 Tax=Tenacibaculum dicentrarchi TaxID=669041 RepID=UPI000C40EA21|nr:Protein of unknown function precursor [Tenacibaculum dicentrarchi]SOU87292.1 conserved exported hypothetical protein [Tenacibaculum dicentrarchi]
MKKHLITFIIVLVSISSNAQSWSGANKIKGNGNSITKTRTITSFDKVYVNGSFNVNLIDGNEGTITLKGEENILPYIETYVKKGRLLIKFKKNTNINTVNNLIITVPFQSIKKVSLNGSGNIKIKKTIKSNVVSFDVNGSGNIIADVNTKTVTTSINGSGNINLTGSTTNFENSLIGSGNLKAYHLKTKYLNANITGSGNMKTTVNKEIKANIIGSGNLYYKGNPKNIKIKSVGSGDIIGEN